MATITGPSAPAATGGQYVYVITDQAGNTLTVTAQTQYVTFVSSSTGIERDGQSLLVTLLLLLASGRKPLVQAGTSSFFDYA